MANAHEQVVKAHEQIAKVHEWMVKVHEWMVKVHEWMVKANKQMVKANKWMVKVHEWMVKAHEQMKVHEWVAMEIDHEPGGQQMNQQFQMAWLTGFHDKVDQNIQLQMIWMYLHDEVGQYALQVFH